MMDLSGQSILVIGLGKTGTATARFLSRQGADVIVTDEKHSSELREPLGQLQREGMNIRFRPCVPDILSDVQMVVPSPGVPPLNRMLVEARHKNKPVLSELELASRFLKRPMIAITGTNGKTTTTTLVGDILSKSGMSVFVGGNIGTPLIGYVDGPQQDDYVVVEVSSFQLQWTREFRPDVAVLLNVTADHVDYHGTFADYRLAKERIFKNQTRQDLAILNTDDNDTETLSHKRASKIAYFSSSRQLTRGIFLDGGQMVYRPFAGETETYPLDMVKIPGVHNIENVMAAVMAARWAGCRRETIIKTVGHFRGVAHRIEYAGEKDGVVFYDDSKATNVGAVLRALETFSRPVVLLMGGRDKQGNFESLAAMIEKKVKTLILFGEARERIAALLGGVVETYQATTLREAMPLAGRSAAAGDVVLLAPGCASFDEFKDYKERGDVFKQWIGSLS
ncbi:MAG: UDP-N-acetylmuramoyl-L-alanine--D-glutamate ligase [Candidatus Aminicenantes bacterium]|nr:UDP-N-acetylmuramoyl-L-alanine--D-glutamate ligase [Candidatus Aminicenantes bacterium]